MAGVMMAGENNAALSHEWISGSIIKRLINGFPNLTFKMFGAAGLFFACFIATIVAIQLARTDTCYFQRFSTPLIAKCKITRTT